MNIQAWVSVLLVSGLILGPAQSADKLEAIDVTEGTQVSFSKGFQIADEGGIWYIPAGALLLAPSITVKGPLTLETEGSSNDQTFKRGGRIVWTNGDAANTTLQAMSLEGPVTAVINSSTAELGNQSFSLEPSISAERRAATRMSQWQCNKTDG
ncbi:hypothetical protein WJX75_005223 [Coccomyxa subellipsoidea]|uniref:Uncharacterized protein n=1 Tax=Coccomyxa subellipsoidea TaxID=248742 RepID=A0ABR2Z3W4_9CHLO